MKQTKNKLYRKSMKTYCETCGLTMNLFTNRIENTTFNSEDEQKVEYVKFDLCDTCYAIIAKKMVKKITELQSYYKNND